MAALLKNIFFTALMICVATVATVTIGCVAALLLDGQAVVGSTPLPLAALIFGLLIAAALAMLTGIFFCIVTLFVAATTMPPVIWAARWLKLPRPLVDVIGGSLAAWLCVLIGLDEGDSLRQYGMTFPEPLFVGIGIVAGGLVGYLRFRCLGRGASSAVAAASALPAT
jgi:hypothetical protein